MSATTPDDVGAYRALLALRQAARHLDAVTSEGSDLDNVAALVESLCAERLAPVAGLAPWATV